MTNAALGTEEVCMIRSVTLINLFYFSLKASKCLSLEVIKL